MSISLSQLLNIRMALAKYPPFNFEIFDSQIFVNSCAATSKLCSAASAMLCFNPVWDFLGFGTGLGPGWYTGATVGIIGSSST